MTIVQPYESSRIDWGVDDWMVVDEDYTSPQDFNQTYAAHKVVPVETFTSAMVRNGIIDDYIYFKFTENWYEVNTWEMQVSQYEVNSSRLAVGGFIRYYHNGAEHVGIIESIEKPLGQEGKASQKWLVRGSGVESVLGQRLAIYGMGSGDGYHTVSAVSATTAMREYVDYECITSAKCGANRVITGLTLDGSPAADATVVTYSARLQYLTDILYDICTQTAKTYYLQWSGSGLNFVFKVKSGTDRTTSVKISPEFDNVQSLKYLYTAKDMKNVAYVGGVGTANTRDIDDVHAVSEPTGWDRREVFVEASDCLNTAAMLSRGTSTLATMDVQSILEVDYLESNTFKYGTDFVIGDIVTIVFPDVITTTGQIISSTEYWSTSGLKISLVIGRAYPTLIGVMKDQSKSTSAQVRR